MNFSHKVVALLVSGLDAAQIGRRLRELLPEDEARDCSDLLARFDGMSLQEWVSGLGEVSPPPLAYALLTRRLFRDPAFLSGDVPRNLTRLRDQMDLDEPQASAVDLCQGRADLQDGILAAAAASAERIRGQYRGISEPIQGQLLACACDLLGEVCEAGGNYWRAELHYREARRLFRGWGYGARSSGQHLANLLWQSGQFARALATHRDVTQRRQAETDGAFDYVARCHISAAKCALDLRQRELFAGTEQPRAVDGRDLLELAAEELDSGRRILAEHPEQQPWWLEGYHTVYSGQLAIHQDDLDLARERYLEGASFFRSREPAFHPGVMMAKYELLGLEMWTHKNKQKCAEMVENLIDEAERLDVMEARTRLMALEAALFLSDQPPIREAFDNLVERVHLMNNPRIMFMALGNLLGYAAKNGMQAEASHLRSRIARLKPLLKRSCYDDLFREYVAERYLWAAEERWLEDEARFELEEE